MTYKGLVEPCGYWRRNNAEIENKTKTKRKSENKARKGWKIEKKTGKPIEARTKRKQWVQTERREKRSYNPELRRSVSFVEKKILFRSVCRVSMRPGNISVFSQLSAH